MLRRRTATNQLEHFHFCLLHNDAAHSVRSLAPRSEAERSGERVGVRGIFSARPPHPILDVATTEVPSRRKRGEGAITMTARVTTSHHFPHSRFRSRGAFSAPGFCNFGFATPIEGWRSAESRRVLARHPLGLHVTRQARRWRGALRPSEDARLPALHRGGFGLRCRAFPHRNCFRIGPSELLAPGRSARRRLSVPPGAAVTSRCRRTPRLAPSSRIVS